MVPDRASLVPASPKAHRTIQGLGQRRKKEKERERKKEKEREKECNRRWELRGYAGSGA